MIKVKSIRTLEEPFISAASGLIEIENKFYVVADDEHYLGIFPKGQATGKLAAIFPGEFPPDQKERKKVKPDLESLVQLPDSTILLIPSGSTQARRRGALVDKTGKLLKEISFSSLFNLLEGHFPELNIEGAAATDHELWLWQRGNGSRNENAVIKIHLNSFLRGEINLISIQHIGLGRHKNVNLSFTDACITKAGIFFLAVAEDTTSTYLDGTILGSYLGLMDAAGNILIQEELDLRSKPEGLCVDCSTLDFFLVTDDDDRTRAAQIFQGKLPSAWRSHLVL